LRRNGSAERSTANLRPYSGSFVTMPRPFPSPIRCRIGPGRNAAKTGPAFEIPRAPMRRSDKGSRSVKKSSRHPTRRRARHSRSIDDAGGAALSPTSECRPSQRSTALPRTRATGAGSEMDFQFNRSSPGDRNARAVPQCRGLAWHQRKRSEVLCLVLS